MRPPLLQSALVLSGFANAIAFTAQPYTTIASWCNPRAETLSQVDADLWAAPRPFVWNNIDVGGRMAVVRLADGRLWVHSPVQLDDSLRLMLSSLGPVAYIVSPNYEHVKYAKQWKLAFPEALALGCPGLKAKEPSIPFDDELSPSRTFGFEDSIDTVFLDVEHNPLTRKPFFNECVFYARSARAVITADFFWNYPADVPLGTRLWKFGMDRVYKPFYSAFMIKDRLNFDATKRRLNEWDVQKIVPCHGGIVLSEASRVWMEHLASL